MGKEHLKKYHWKPDSEKTPEELAQMQDWRQKGADANKAKAKLRRETLDRGKIVDEALLSLVNEDPQMFNKVNKRLLDIAMSTEKDADVLKAMQLFSEINQLKAPKNEVEKEMMKPMTPAEREKKLKEAGVKIVNK